MNSFAAHIFFLLLSLMFVSVGTAEAHVVKNSVQVSAIMHIQPDDDPVAGQDTRLQFTFASSDNVFKVPNCDCSVIVIQNEQEVAHIPLTGNDTIGFSQVTFPNIGEYQVQLHGNARDNSFEPFTLDYVARADRSLEQPSSLSKGGIVVVVLGVVVLSTLWFFALRLIRRGKRY